MANHEQIANRWAQQAGLPGAKFLHGARSNVIVSDYDGGHSLYSWGSHFTLAKIMLNAAGERAWFLVNGDKYSHSTNMHQSLTRSAIKATGLPSMIVPFTALTRAGIDQASITPVEILKDRYEPVTRYAATRNDVPRYTHDGTVTPVRLPDGRWSYQDREHHLGEAIFTAKYCTGWDQESGHAIYTTATFLSSFDTQEGFGLYFLAELPQGCNPQTVAGALEALKPDMVHQAESEGAEVLRQGDVFAIPYHELLTRELTAMSAVRERMGYVLDVNHMVTDVAVVPYDSGNVTYGRGIMRHRPREIWRDPEHKTVKLGDQKTWYRLVKNTVPEGRSWSIDGKID